MWILGLQELNLKPHLAVPLSFLPLTGSTTMLCPPNTICSLLLRITGSADSSFSPASVADFPVFAGALSCSLSCPISTPESSSPVVTFLAAELLSAALDALVSSAYQ